MSFDLAELQSKVNNYTTVVGSWMKNVGNLYFSATPQNVSVKLLDENGNVKTNTIPNAAQFRKRVWDDVGGAIGQFNKSIVVDQLNGDDTNDGSGGSPLKTLGKACSLVPTGGHGSITIVGNYTFNENIDISFKKIHITYKGKITIDWYVSNELAFMYHFDLNASDLMFRVDNQETDVEPTLYSKNETTFAADNNSSFFRLSEYHSDVNISFWYRNRVPNAKLIEFLNGRLIAGTYGANNHTGKTSLNLGGYYSGKFVFGANSIVADVNKCGALTFVSKLNGITYEDETGQIDITTKFSGIVKDTNGVPRNVQSNLIF